MARTHPWMQATDKYAVLFPLGLLGDREMCGASLQLQVPVAH